MSEGKWIWRGLSGRSYAFAYAPALAAVPDVAGVFVLAAHGDGMPRALYVGDAEDVAASVGSAHTLMAAALRLGLSHLHILPVEGGAAARQRVKADLSHALSPSLNGRAARVLPIEGAALDEGAGQAGGGWGIDLLTGLRAGPPTRH